AGGALISIPLFINIVNLGLKEATILSLVAVVFGTSINMWGQMKKVHLNITIPLALAGIISNYLSLPLKKIVPDVIVALLLTLIALYSLWGVWSGGKNEKKLIKENNTVIKALVAGTVLGLLTTLTGLGGGVVLIPVLIRVFGKSYEEALPTSLGTVLVISLSSFLMQFSGVKDIASINEIIYLGIGSFLSFFLLKIGIKKLSKETIGITRQITFSLVAVYSVTSVIIKAL